MATTSDHTGRFEVQTSAESHFSWIRTRLSTERTLMSWVRTATALIGFGFTIVQFFAHLNDITGVKQAWKPEMPRYLGLALIASGIGALAISVWQYRSILRYLRSKDFAPIAGIDEVAWRTPLLAVTIALIVIGLVAFGSVLLRLV